MGKVCASSQKRGILLGVQGYVPFPARRSAEILALFQKTASGLSSSVAENISVLCFFGRQTLLQKEASPDKELADFFSEGRGW